MLFVVVGCSENNKLSPIDKQYTEADTLEIKTKKTEYSKDVKVIRYIIKNNSEFKASYGTYVYLNMLKDGEWYTVEFNSEDYGFTDILFSLPAHEQTEEELHLENAFNLPLDEGEYRIVLEGDGNSATISNTFTVK